MTTDPNTLPHHESKPVPWVTRWTNEIAKDRYQYGIQVLDEHTLRTAYKDGKEFRDEHGVLWQREGITRGGRPDWASVSTYRQRMSMRRRVCQVCGQKITETPIRWLMPRDGIEYLDEDTPLTQQPPTCSGCIPLALELCPHLNRNGYKILRVLDYEVWGVQGEVVVSLDGQPRRIPMAVSYDTTQYGEEFSLGQVWAQQQVVRLGKFSVEEDVVP